MTSLFRPEALAHAHAQAKPYGTIILTRGPGQGLLVMLLCLLVVALIVWVASASYTRKAQVTGVLQPSQGVTRVIPMQAGQVVSVQVKEGQTVQAGDVMFVLSSERDTVSSGLAEAHISSLLRERRESLAQGQAQQQVLMAHRIASLGQRAQDLQAERRRIHAQIQLQHRRVALSESTVARQRELHEASFVSAAQVHGAQADLLDQQQRMAELERSLSALDRETASTEAEAQALRIQANLDLDAGRQLVNTAQQALAENEARRQTVIRAPSQGVVSALTVQQGQTVSAGQVLASVLPQYAALEAWLYAPSRAAGFLKPGMKVGIRYHAYPYEKFGQALGTIREVSPSALAHDDLSSERVASWHASAGEPLYRIRVTLPKQTITVSGTELPLTPGALLDASVLLETRRLHEWILAPLYAAKERA